MFWVALAGIALLLILFYACGFALGYDTAVGEWKREALRRGFADYDPMVKGWHWKDPNP